MKKDDNWGITLLAIMICVYFLLNFFFTQRQFNRLQTEIRERVDGRVSIVVHQLDDVKDILTKQCGTKE